MMNFMTELNSFCWLSTRLQYYHCTSNQYTAVLCYTINFKSTLLVCSQIWIGVRVMDSHVYYTPSKFTYWGPDKMADFMQTKLSNALSWVKMPEFFNKVWLKCISEALTYFIIGLSNSLVLSATGHYLNRYSLRFMMPNGYNVLTHWDLVMLWCQRPGSILLQLMTWCLFGTKSLP